jgi:isocitrate dehydrogenase (NAD+)
VDAGGEVAARYGTPLPESVLNSVRVNRVALKGPVTTPVGEGFGSVNVALRKGLNLYACLRPVRSLPGVRSRYQDIDLVVVRENTEGLYSGIEHLVVPGVAESLKIITEQASTRIAHFAFRYARQNGRRKVTAVHKANIMKVSDGLFLESVRRARRSYPDIEYEELIVDAVCMNLVRDPYRFDVLLMENLYGDILSDLCAGLVGGLGVVPGANIGDDCAVFEAVHGSAPDIAGKGIANPTACILSAAMMLDHIGERPAATRVREALSSVLAEGSVLTPDLGGHATTRQMTQAICERLASPVLSAG